jgi:2-oxoglutarate ferredoxin oxidoreductase subunit beta
MTTGCPAAALSRQDFISDQTVRWCPGCGDYTVLATVQRLLPTLGIPRENFAFVSGIGCSSRFPYYMNTYGMHSIHGRAPAIATGLKLSRPELSVWVVTGDGDALAIGGNHFIHAMRRNADLKIILLNNRIYGLTKGQVSPTSELGMKSKTTPLGSIDRPFNPSALALAAGATFVARTVDGDMPHMSEVLRRAAAHRGTAFVEVLQNCVVFNDGAHKVISDKRLRDDTRVLLEHGKPLVWGSRRQWGLRLDGLLPRRVDHDGVQGDSAGLLVHDESASTPHLAFALSQLEGPDLPVALGVLRAVSQPTYDELNAQLVEQVRSRRPRGRLADLLAEGDVWTVHAGESVSCADPA